MNFRAPRPALLAAAVCSFGLLIQPAPANPLKAIGSGIKKVGTALTPWKKQPAAAPAEKPAPAPKPVKAAPKPAAKTAKATPSKKASSKKPSQETASTNSSKSKTSKTSKTGSATKTGAAAAAAAGAAGATGPESASDVVKDGALPPTGEAGANGDTPPDTAAATPPAAPVEIPFGTPVMGRKGYVHSPFAPEQPMVDVSEIAAGTKVKCPFTGKIFRVP